MRRSTAHMAAATLLLLVSSLAVACMPVVEYGETSEELETRRMFRDWMAENQKTYSSTDEEEHQYAVFKENRRRIDMRKAATDTAGVRITDGLIVFADLTDEELRSLHTGCALEHRGIEALYRNLASDIRYFLDRRKILR